MNIAVIAHLHYPIKQPYAGGLEAHTDLLVRQLTTLGHTVTLYAKAGSETNSKQVPVFIGSAKGGKSKMLKYAYKYACNHIMTRHYDLIFNNSLNGYPFKWHTPTMPPMITIFHTPPFWELSNVIEQQAAQDNRIFVAVSQLTADQWQEFCSDTIHVVPNGINITNWQPHIQKPQNESAIWSGRITPEKGTHIAIKAAQIAKIPLILCGPIYDSTYFKDVIMPLIDNRLVQYKGNLNQQSLNKLYGNASVALVTPLWDEPFGYVTVEALASGTPVAALAHGATASILQNTYGKLVTSDSPKDLATALRQAIKIDRQICADYAHKTYSVETTVTNYLALLPQLYEDIPLLWQTSP